jgi:ComF family protein
MVTPLAAVWRAVQQRKMPIAMQKFSHNLIDAVFPARCWQCEQMYLRERGGLAASESGMDAVQTYGSLFADYLCPQCAKLYTPIRSPLCSKCGRPFGTRHGVDHKCPDCEMHPFGFDEARAAGMFDRTLKTIIHQYKYHGRAELVRPMGKMLWTALHHFYDAEAFDLILPVPLHWFRKYRRGFNQAALLVRQLARLADDQGVRFKSEKVPEKILIRRHHTVSQTGLGKQQRIENLKNAFAVRNKSAVAGRNILIIDDVLTTGTTTDACARTLKTAGASSVKVLTVARAV